MQAVPLFLSEIAPPLMRGFLNQLFQLATTIGAAPAKTAALLFLISERDVITDGEPLSQQRPMILHVCSWLELHSGPACLLWALRLCILQTHGAKWTVLQASLRRSLSTTERCAFLIGALREA